MDPRHNVPAGGGGIMFDVGQRKYVLIKDML